MNKPVLKALAAAAFACAAAPSLALDLMGAYTQAVAHDPTLAAAQQALAAGREKAVQGRSLLLPQVQLTASATYLRDSSSSSAATCRRSCAMRSSPTARARCTRPRSS